MASILFVTWDGGGNLPPALGIAAELRERGRAGALPRTRAAARHDRGLGTGNETTDLADQGRGEPELSG
jgi:hypothetical protein